MKSKCIKNLNENVIVKKAEKDKYAPDSFYSTTNYDTEILRDNKWIKVKQQRMDGLIVLDNHGATCKKLRDIKQGDMVVCGNTGIRIKNNSEKEELYSSFNFMNSNTSSERRNILLIQNLANELFYDNKKLTVVAGPVVVHTGGDFYLSQLIKDKYVESLLIGNALAVHDIEKFFFGTSLGICSKSGNSAPDGYMNHMRAINQVMKHGSIENIVKSKVLSSGIMYECVENNIPFVLAGSLRDDGPLPDTITDMIQAQEAYNKHLQSADIVLVLGSMLHGIASGNMLPAKTKMICVDINPSVVTKLSDRGSSQTIGIITDVGLFLNLLLYELANLKAKASNQLVQSN